MTSVAFSDVRAVDGRERAMPAPPSTASDPPLTNRGGLRPYGHVDYVKVTVWGDVADVMRILGWSWVEKYLGGTGEWEDKGPAARLSARWSYSDAIHVLQYSDGADFCSVELKGRECSLVGSEGIASLLAELGHRWEIRCSRVDYAWDAVPFDVAMFRQAIVDRNIRTHVPYDGPDFHESPTGNTCYFPKRRADRFVRVYDRRGPVRFEIQFGSEYAEKVGDAMRAAGLETWPDMFMSHVRALLDVIVRDNERVTRCSLQPWWAEFIEDAAKASYLRVVEKQYAPNIQKLIWALRHGARPLEWFRRSFGDQAVATLIQCFMHGRWSSVDDKAMAEWAGKEIESYNGGFALFRDATLVGSCEELPF
jgi:hypothetical protein